MNHSNSHAWVYTCMCTHVKQVLYHVTKVKFSRVHSESVSRSHQLYNNDIEVFSSTNSTKTETGQVVNLLINNCVKVNYYTTD